MLDHSLHGEQSLVEQQEAAGKAQTQGVDDVEHLMKERGHIHVRRRHAEVAAESLLDGLVDRLVGGRAPLHPQPVQRTLDAGNVRVHNVQEEPDSLLEVLAPEKAGRAEVKQGDPPLPEVRDVGRMRVPVEEAVVQYLLEPAVGDGRRKITALLGRQGGDQRAVEGRPVDALHGQYAAGAMAPEHAGDAHQAPSGEVLREPFGVPSFEDVVEFASDRTRELVHHRVQRESDVHTPIQQLRPTAEGRPHPCGSGEERPGAGS